MGTEALRCEARVSWRAFETRKACDLRAKMLFQLKKPRVNSNATPRGCRERTLCTSDEHYHTHTHNTKHLYSRARQRQRQARRRRGAHSPAARLQRLRLRGQRGALLRTHAGAASSLLSREDEEFVRVQEHACAHDPRRRRCENRAVDLYRLEASSGRYREDPRSM